LRLGLLLSHLIHSAHIQLVKIFLRFAHCIVSYLYCNYAANSVGLVIVWLPDCIFVGYYCLFRK